MLERAGRITMAMERQEQMHITRKPVEGTVTFLFQRLATSGAVQTSSLLLMARSWASQPELFRCFEAPRPELPMLGTTPLLLGTATG
eukprot:Skav207228  [mRNA]  locus=scaffold1717:132172:135174:+ [translate_table: standard]